MTINRQKFYRIARRSSFNNVLTQEQVNGMNAILDEWESRKYTDLRYLGYMMATSYWETNKTMNAVREAYWTSEAWRKANLRYYPWYGRGLVQLTWEDNYRKMSKLLGVDLIKNPDLALQLDISVQILFEGMMDASSGVGDFTNKALDEFFNDSLDDPIAARTIINGNDKDREIADIFYKFHYALSIASV